MHCNFLNIYHRRLKLGRIVPHSQCKSLVRFQPFLTFSQPSAVPGVLASGMALLQMAGNHCNRLAHSVGLLGSLPQPQKCQSFAKIPHVMKIMKIKEIKWVYC